MNTYLVESKSYFYDGHGEGELGGTTYKTLSTDVEYDPNLVYDDDGNIFDENHPRWAEDGYNCEATKRKYKKITEWEARKFHATISDYNAFEKLF
jgi:hypothetical protein